MDAHPDQGSTGDAEAFAALYGRYRGRLMTYCRRRLFNPADAEDAVHETMLRAYRAFPAFDGADDAWPWLVTIAARVCTDVRRRQQRTAQEPLSTTVEDVHEAAVGRLRADIVDAALDRLPARYRTTLVLHEFGGWTYSEIAEVQGKSVASVRSLLTRSRRRLSTGIEVVARSRNQWPLPGALPSVARRLRNHLRSLLDRPLPTALLGLDPTFLLSRLGAAPAALAGVLVFGTGVPTMHDPTSAIVSLTHPAAAVPPTLRTSAALSSPPVVGDTLQTGEAVARDAARLTTTTPAVGTSGGEHTELTADTVVTEPSHYYIYFGHRMSGELAVIGRYESKTEVNIGCQPMRITPVVCELQKVMRSMRE